MEPERTNRKSIELWQALQNDIPLPSRQLSDGELKELAVRGGAANAILAAFPRDIAVPLDAPRFDTYLQEMFTPAPSMMD